MQAVLLSSVQKHIVYCRTPHLHSIQQILVAEGFQQVILYFYLFDHQAFDIEVCPIFLLYLVFQPDMSVLDLLYYVQILLSLAYEASFGCYFKRFLAPELLSNQKVHAIIYLPSLILVEWTIVDFRLDFVLGIDVDVLIRWLLIGGFMLFGWVMVISVAEVVRFLDNRQIFDYFGSFLVFLERFFIQIDGTHGLIALKNKKIVVELLMFRRNFSFLMKIGYQFGRACH